jgi:hypothetical protein
MDSTYGRESTEFGAAKQPRGGVAVADDTVLDEFAQQQIDRYFADLPEVPAPDELQAEADILTRLIDFLDEATVRESAADQEAVAKIRMLLVAERSSRRNTLASRKGSASGTGETQ